MLSRRAALPLFGAFALAPFGALAQGAPRFRAIQVDVSPLRTNMGDDTANWVAQALPKALAERLGPYYRPGDRNGAVLTARIDWVYLGPSSGGTGAFGSTQDTIEGALVIRGPRGSTLSETPLRATSSYLPSPVDQPLWVESNRSRITILAQSFAAWAPRELGL